MYQKEKTYQPRNLYPVKLPFQSKEEILSQTNENLREFAIVDLPCKKY